jgi:Fur family ferric uptake transcriptional regulator
LFRAIVLSMARQTRQRQAIRRAFEDAQRPLGASEVLEAAGSHTPGLGIATVYRALKGLVEEGWLTPVELPGEAPRYEPAGKKHHDHFRCRRCDRVFEIACAVRLPKLRGFVVEDHEVVLTGLCAQCASLRRRSS